MAKPSEKAKRMSLYFFTSEDPVTSQDSFIAGKAGFQWENHTKCFTSLYRRHTSAADLHRSLMLSRCMEHTDTWRGTSLGREMPWGERRHLGFSKTKFKS